MKIGILHLTDMHFTEKTDLTSKIHSFCRAIINDFIETNRLYLIISGDVTFSGTNKEFEQAKKFLSLVKTLLNGELKQLEIKYIIVPGNHDCNFKEYDSQLRRNSIQNINYNTIGTDDSVINLCLDVQKNFWEFYSIYNEVPSDKLFYLIEDKADDKTISFYCMNTAWISQLNESVGSVFFPVKKYDKIRAKNNSINFGVWHHPYNWFSPNTIENNKAEFEFFTEHLSSTHFFGHEHVQSNYLNENRNTGKKINLLSGEIFNEDKKNNKSGFQTLLFNTSDSNQEGELKKYEWDGTIYKSVNSKSIEFFKEATESFQLNEEFIQTLQEVKIPIVLESKKDLILSDIFIYPDIESTTRDSNKFENYTNSVKLVEGEFEYCILDGESQVGKTSLLSMLFLKLFEMGIFPLLIKGKDIKEQNLDKLLFKSFKVQYKNRTTHNTRVYIK